MWSNQVARPIIHNKCIFSLNSGVRIEGKHGFFVPFRFLTCPIRFFCPAHSGFLRAPIPVFPGRLPVALHDGSQYPVLSWLRGGRDVGTGAHLSRRRRSRHYKVIIIIFGSIYLTTISIVAFNTFTVILIQHHAWQWRRHRDSRYPAPCQVHTKLALFARCLGQSRFPWAWWT